MEDAVDTRDASYNPTEREHVFLQSKSVESGHPSGYQTWLQDQKESKNINTQASFSTSDITACRHHNNQTRREDSPFNKLRAGVAFNYLRISGGGPRDTYPPLHGVHTRARERMASWEYWKSPKEHFRYILKELNEASLPASLQACSMAGIAGPYRVEPLWRLDRDLGSKSLYPLALGTERHYPHWPHSWVIQSRSSLPDSSCNCLIA